MSQQFSKVETSFMDGITLPSRPAQRSTGHPQAASVHHRTVQPGTLEPALMAVIRQWLRPAIAVLTLLLCMLAFGQRFTAQYAALALITLLLCAQIFSPGEFQSFNGAVARSQPSHLRYLLEWLAVLGSLLVLGFSLDLIPVFATREIAAWLLVTPLVMLFTAPRFTRWITHKLVTDSAAVSRYIVVGANDLGLEVARRLQQDSCMGKFLGFFDFRSTGRLAEVTRKQLVGRCEDVAEYVRWHGVTTIYIALPIANQPRIQALLRDLRDTTASVYFVPNIFAYDLVQPRCVDINGIPAFSVCDTPFQGMSEVRKRVFDIALSSLALLLIWPLLLAISLAIKLTSPGPVLFKQRRYGLNSEEILVYKFRSMTVTENGGTVTQATRNDRRITPLGAFLRRTSLDELPQIINVWRGTMSFVGPRPHAVAHNEQYRKLISGYMIRHKVRPGITGWAQVNGLRGETETVDKMQRRVQCDIEYINNWSIWFDIKIIARTFLTVLGDKHAY